MDERRFDVHLTDIIDGRPMPGKFGAVWHLPQGRLPYITGRLIELTRNVPPGS